MARTKSSIKNFFGALLSSTALIPIGAVPISLLASPKRAEAQTTQNVSSQAEFDAIKDSLGAGDTVVFSLASSSTSSFNLNTLAALPDDVVFRFQNTTWELTGNSTYSLEVGSTDSRIGDSTIDLTNGASINVGSGNTAINNVSSAVDIQNSGFIVGDINLANDTSITIDNVIENTQFGRIEGDIFFGEGSHSLTNAGAIVGGISFFDVDTDPNSITNSGTIEGNIDFNNGRNSITNTGEIEGNISFGYSNNVVTNEGSFLGGITFGNGGDRLTNSGTIQSGSNISFSHGDNTLNNTGTIEANISFGNNDDILTNSGRIVGNISFASGNDTFNLGSSGFLSGSGFIDGAGGNDALHLGIAGDVAGNFNLNDIGSGQTYRGFDDLDIRVGNWTFSGTNSASWEVYGGATLTLAEDARVGIIYGTAGNETVINNSTIVSNVSLGDGSDVFTNNGTISSGVDVNLGDGDDEFILSLGGSVAGDIDGGEGDDVFIATYANNSVLDLDSSIHTNFETFRVNSETSSGTLYFTGSGTFLGTATAAGNGVAEINNVSVVALNRAGVINTGDNVAIKTVSGSGNHNILIAGSLTGNIDLTEQNASLALGTQSTFDGQLFAGSNSPAFILGVDSIFASDAADAADDTGTFNLSRLSGDAGTERLLVFSSTNSNEGIFSGFRINEGTWRLSGSSTLSNVTTGAIALADDTTLILEEGASLGATGNTDIILVSSSGFSTEARKVAILGALNGGATFSSGDDVFSLGTGGTVEGNVNAALGDADELRLGYAGQTSDTGSFDLASIAADGKYRNFENYTVAVGSWALSGIGGDWNVGDDATLTLSSGSELSSITGSAGANTVSNSGTITGAVNLNDGDDEFILGAAGSIDGILDGGGDSDTLQLGVATDAESATGSLNLSNVSGFETQQILRGNWTFSGNGVGTWALSGNSDLTLALNSSIDAGTGDAITAGDGDNTITNSGDIIGAVNLGGGDDEFILSLGGSIDSVIDGGDGDDVFIATYANNSVIDLSISFTDNFEVFRVNSETSSGVLYFTGESSFPGIAEINNVSVVALNRGGVINTGDNVAIKTVSGSGNHNILIAGSLTGNIDLTEQNASLALGTQSTFDGQLFAGSNSPAFALGVDSTFNAVAADSADAEGSFNLSRLSGDADTESLIVSSSIDSTVGTFSSFRVNEGTWRLSGSSTLSNVNTGNIVLADDTTLILEEGASLGVTGNTDAILLPSSLLTSEVRKVAILGALNGGATLGSGDDVFSLGTGGTVAGNVSAAFGDADELRLGYAGQTSDTGSFDLASIATDGKYRNFENYTVAVGNWTFSGTGTNAWTLENDVDLTLEAAASIDVGSSNTAITGGAGSNTITNLGSIIGAVNLNDGDDTFILGAAGSIDGSLDGGGDSDTLQLGVATDAENATGSLNLSNVSGFETQQILRGNWTFSGTGSNWSLSDNTTLTLSSGSELSSITGSAGANTIVNSGTITSNVNLGGGADQFTLGATGSLAGTVSGGAGSDTLQLGVATDAESATGNLNLSNAIGFESHQISRGSWTFSGAGTNAWSIADNADLTLSDGASIDVGSSNTAITGGTGNNTVTISGSIIGDINLGGGNDTLSLTSTGSIAGNVNGGAGNDGFTINADVSGTLSGGEGDDRFNINSEISGTVSAGEGNDLITSNGAIVSGGVTDLGAGNDRFTLASSGSIAGTVNGGTGNDTFTSDGEISGTIDGGEGNDAFTNNGAILSGGVVNLGAGDDTFVLGSSGSVSGTIDSGVGSNNLTLGGDDEASAVTGEFNLSDIGAEANYRGFENFEINKGTWTFSGAGTNAWTIGGGAALILSEGASIDVSAGETATAIVGGAGSNTLTNRGGITGNVELGDSNDFFVLGTTGSVNGVVDAGSGVDDFYLGSGDEATTVTGEFNLGEIGAEATYRGFENYYVNLGTWTFSGAGTNGWIVRGGTTLILAESASLDGDIVELSGANTVTNRGSITGNISLGGGVDTLTNSATITGNVNLGIDNDTVTNSGTITGNVDLGTGDDFFSNTGSVSGTIDGGAGVDSIARFYDASTTIDLSSFSSSGIEGVTGFEVVRLTSNATGVVIDLNNAGTFLGTADTQAAAESRLEIGNIDAVILNRGAVINTGANTAIKTATGSNESSILIAGDLTGNVDLTERNATFGLGTQSTFNGALLVGSNTPTLALGIDSSFASGDSSTDSGSYNLDNLASLISDGGSFSGIRVNAGTWTLSGSSNLSNVTSGNILLNGGTKLVLSETATLGAAANTDTIIASSDAASTETREVEILGTLNGGASFGAGNDVFALGANASVSGVVDAAGGNDQLRINSNSSLIDSSDFNLDDIGAGQKYSGFEEYFIDGGAVTFTGAGTNAWTITGNTRATIVHLTQSASIDVGVNNLALSGGNRTDNLRVSGSIIGDVKLGGNNDSFTLASTGSVNGYVDGEDGDDVLILGDSDEADTITDNFNLSEIGAAAGYRNFETFQIDQGTWTFSGAGTNAWALNNDAGLTLASGASIDVGSGIAAITASDGNNSVTNSGTITGNVDLGSGVDTFTLGSTGSVTGVVDGGNGSDSLYLGVEGDTEGSFDLSTIGSSAAYRSFEDYFVSVGSWTLSGESNDTWNLSAGTTLILASEASINVGSGNDAIQASIDSNTLNNYGTITGNINLRSGDDAVTNSGTITGDVDLGEDRDTLTNSGTITGDINLGVGDDNITNTGSITGTVDGGAGIDSITSVYDASTTLDLTSLELGAGTFINFESVGLTSSAAGVVIGLNNSGDFLGTAGIPAASPESRLEIGNIDAVILNRDAVINTGSNTAFRTLAGTGQSSILIAGDLTGNVDLTARNATFGLGTQSTFNGTLAVGSNTPTLALGIDSSYGSGDALTDSGSYNLDNLASLLSGSGSLSDIRVNAGTWTLTGSSDLSNVANGIKLNGNTNARLTLSEGATLGAADNTDTIITSSDEASTEARVVSILGTLNGGASFGAGNDIFTLGTGATVSGNVDAQGGDADELRLGHADQSSNTGDFDLASIGAEAKFRNFENFSVVVGDWTFNGAGTNGWTLADGTSLTLAVGASIDVGTGDAITGTSGVNTVNSLGSITGNVNLDGGDDIFTLGTDATVSGNVDAQGGDADVLRLGHADQSSNTGSFDLSDIGADQKYRNFESFSVRTGDWTFSGAGSNGWTLSDAADLTLAEGASINVGSSNAAITGDAGDNTVTILGSVTGNMLLLGGDDIVRFGVDATFDDIVSGSSGFDRFYLNYGSVESDSSTFDLDGVGIASIFDSVGIASIVEFEEYNIDGGTVSFTGNASVSWNLNNGANVRLEAATVIDTGSNDAITGGAGANTVTNLGAITGNVNLNGGDDTVTNSGNITGDVDLGVGNDTLTNSGNITGNISLGDGDDNIADTGTITGTLDGGAGIDSITRVYGANTSLNLDDLELGTSFTGFEAIRAISNEAGAVIELNSSGDFLGTEDTPAVDGRLEIGNIDAVILNRGAVINTGANTAIKTAVGTSDSSILIAGSFTGNVDLSARNATFGLGTQSTFNGTLAVGSNTPTLALGIDSSYESGDALSDIGSYNLDNLASLISGSGSLSDIRVNAGTWTLTGSSDLTNVTSGIKLNGNTSARLTLSEGATLGADGNTDTIITSSDAASTVTREVSILGMLNGGVSFGAGNDEFILGSTGSVAGEVSGGAGSDTLQLGSGLDADDVEGDINLANFVEFETNQINRGSWTFSGAGTNGWTLRNAADVTLASGASIDVGTGDAITGETGANTVTNSGSITGNVNLGGGDDLLNLGTSGSITGAVSGGDGNDTLQLGVATDADNAEGNLNLTSFSGFETNQITRGNWTFSGAGTSGWTLSDATDLTLAEGASINVGSDVAAITGSVSGDTINNFGSITGAVNLGSGDDTFTVGSSSSVDGLVTGGEGTDTLAFSNTGSSASPSELDLASVDSTYNASGFERLNLSGGVTKLSGDLGGGTSLVALSVSSGATAVVDTPISIDGNFTTDAGSTLEIQVADSDDDGKVSTTGNYNLGSGSTFRINHKSGGSALVEGASFQVLNSTATSGTNSYANATFESSSILYDFAIDSAATGANTVSVRLENLRSVEEALTEFTSENPLIQETIDSVDSVLDGTSAQAQELRVAFFSTDVTDEQRLDALESLSPIETEQVVGALITTGQSVTTQLSNRTSSRLDSANNSDEYKLLASVEPVPLAEILLGDEFSVWGRGSVNLTDAETSTGAVGYGATTYGLSIGADYKLDRDSLIGLGLNYSNADIKDGGVGTKSQKIDSYALSVYGGHRFSETSLGDVDIKGSLGYGVNTHNTYRNVAIGGVSQAASAKFNSSQFSAFVGASFPTQLSDELIGSPRIGLNLIQINVKSYTETGSSFALDVGSLSHTSWIASSGYAINNTIYGENSDVSINASLDIEFELGDTNPQQTSNFVAGGDNIGSRNNARSNTTAVVNVGAQWQSLDGIDVGASYQGRYSSNYQDNGFFLNFGYKF